MKIYLQLLKEKIKNEYLHLCNIIYEYAKTENFSSYVLLEHSEYFFVKFRIYIYFHDFSSYMEKMDKRLFEFLLSLPNTSDYLTYIYENGFAGDCDLKSVEGIEKLMIFAYNNSQYKTGKYDFLPIEIPL